MKKALVTGGSKGIGKAVCEVLEQNHYQVIAPNRTELDLSSMQSIENFIENSVLDFDVLVNNAGVNPTALLEDTRVEDWDNTLMVNLKAPFMLAQACAPHMRKTKWGRIVNISSTFSKVTKEMRLPYTASKSGLDGVTRSLAVELGIDNVLVNSVCPGFILTELTHQNNTPEQIRGFEALIPQGRLADPAEVAEFVYFLVSEKNTYITGQSLSIDGGFICR